MGKQSKREKIDNLNVEVYSNRQDMGDAAGKAIAQKMRELLAVKTKIRMVFAAAPSQNETLAVLSREEGIDWERVEVFHMDEYIGLPAKAPQLFSSYLKTHLFDIVKPESLYLIDSTHSASEECIRYGKLLSAYPVDIVCLGIGENGHIAFNDPPVADFEDKEIIKPVMLDEICRNQQVHDGCFASLQEVPQQALTLTVPTLFSGQFLFCMVPGKTKNKAVQALLHGPITTACPSSILRRHQNCILYVDKDSYGV